MQNIKQFFKTHGLIILIVSLFVGTNLLYAQKFHNVIWDEAVYLGIGKYLYSFGTVGLWEMIRPIGMPLIIGLFWKLGLPYVFMAELTEIGFSAGVIILTYLITKEFADDFAAATAAFIMAITPVFFLYTGYVLTGIPSTFFILLAFYLFLKDKLAPAGVAAGLASLFRFPQGLFFGSFVGFFTVAIASEKVKRHGTTFWDKKWGFEVSYSNTKLIDFLSPVLLLFLFLIVLMEFPN